MVNKRWQGKLQQHYQDFLETLEDERVGWELSHDEFKDFLRKEFGVFLSVMWEELYQARYPQEPKEEGVTENGPYFGAY
jgi:hypothetical protein